MSEQTTWLNNAFKSRDQLPDHMAMHIRQAAVDAVVADGELFMINAEQVHQRGVDVVAGRRVGAVERLVAPLVAFACNDSALDATAAEPVGEDIGVMVATFATLRAGHAAEFGGPQDDRVIKQAALL